ncbi:hypothetical protein G6F60_015457 [Rhizopus arrhizus]|nr:hypothetical protein G6F60_015457 [Rhizopus arrhizus]
MPTATSPRNRCWPRRTRRARWPTSVAGTSTTRARRRTWKCRSAGAGRSRSAAATVRSRRLPAWPTASAKTPWST